MQPEQLWGMGDYATVGDRWAGAAVDLATSTVEPHHRVLDVACGHGPAAIAAARIGAQVTGLDVSPELLAAARRRAAAARVQVRWVQADMTAMPEPDGSYDRVLSAFGAMFAQVPEAMAAELTRVCAPGGLIGVLAWLPDSAFGQLKPLLGKYLPITAAGPTIEAWAVPAMVEGFFADLPVEVETRVDSVSVRWDSLDQAVHEITTLVPGVVAARGAISHMGMWPQAQEQLRSLLAGHGTEDAGGFTVDVPYLTTLAHRPGV